MFKNDRLDWELVAERRWTGFGYAMDTESIYRTEKGSADGADMEMFGLNKWVIVSLLQMPLLLGVLRRALSGKPPACL